MENLLRAKGLWSLVENGFAEPTAGAILTDVQLAQLEDARTKDHQVKHYLFQAIDRSVFQQILDRRTAKIVWDSMKLKFGGNTKVKKSLLNSLRREFEILAMKNDETVTEYFARVMTVTNQMRSNGEVLTDSKIVEKILRTLTEGGILVRVLSSLILTKFNHSKTAASFSDPSVCSDTKCYDLEHKQLD
ncbi:hypothetical protein M0R45_025464 [Rubus argutus]|uniref:Retrovirus-related Pol polyprotein from transposon TNT 1-94 n=1 Tax=Rubus argutus TaxID=59490 RepID=A0AAW1WUR2_RUBAR